MEHSLILQKIIPIRELEEVLRKIQFRGLYNTKGAPLLPYKDVTFSLTKVYPPRKMGSSPKINIAGKQQELFSPQPTIYENQIEIMKVVDRFLKKEGLKINNLSEAIEYEWQNRGVFHIMPPIVECHVYDLKNGFMDLDKLSKRFKGFFVKDALGNLHDMSERYLRSFFIDEVSRLDYLDVFHSNAPLINYGTQYSGKHKFFIVCDGSHRIDYALETLHEPITVLLVEHRKTPLIPYYAFPVPFRPTIRLSSKRSERMYPRLERDKIHLLNDFINKVLHYDWTEGGLNVSSLRSKKEIY